MKVVIGRSWRKCALYLALCLVFVALGVWIVNLDPSGVRSGGLGQIIGGWGSILFFGGCALVFAWQLMDSRPRVVIDERGIFDPTYCVGVIPWADIRGAYPMSIKGNDFICLELVDNHRYHPPTSGTKRWFGGFNSALGFTPISINLGLASADSADVLELILRYIPRADGAELEAVGSRDDHRRR